MKKNSLLIFISILASCGHKNAAFREVKDRDLTIQVMQLKDAEDDHTISYKARLLPDKKLLESKSKDEKQALYYTMDSCFYINTGNTKIYAALVQPIANGVSGSYEYLLQFEKDKDLKTDTIALVYQDRYINKKTYSLKMSAN
jgi:hypothetical protein